MLRTQGVCFAVAQHADAVQRNEPCGLPHPLFVNCIVPFRECALATFLGEKSGCASLFHVFSGSADQSSRQVSRAVRGLAGQPVLALVEAWRRDYNGVTSRRSPPSSRTVRCRGLFGGAREIRTRGATRASNIPKNAQKWRLFLSTRLSSTQRRRLSPLCSGRFSIEVTRDKVCVTSPRAGSNAESTTRSEPSHASDQTKLPQANVGLFYSNVPGRVRFRCA